MLKLPASLSVAADIPQAPWDPMSSEGPQGKAVLANGKEWVEGEAEKDGVGS